TRRSKGAILEAIADEALRSRRFPGIAFKGSDVDRRAWLIGTGLDVWEVIQALQDFSSEQAMASQTDLTEPQISVCVAYHKEFPEEIDRAIAENRLPLHELRRRYPHVPVV
ncbi:MAG: hypothetical protein ACRDIU_08645, partial [Actinomycetota bacterium]